MQMRQVFIFTLGSGRSYLGMKRTVIFVTCSFFFSSLPSGKILDNFTFSYCNFQLCQHTYVQVESHFRIFCHISSPFSTVQDVVYCYNLNSCQVDTFIKLAGAPVYPPAPHQTANKDVKSTWFHSNPTTPSLGTLPCPGGRPSLLLDGVLGLVSSHVTGLPRK